MTSFILITNTSLSTPFDIPLDKAYCGDQMSSFPDVDPTVHIN